MDDFKNQKAKTVQTFGRKKTAVAVAHTKSGSGLLKVNGVPLELIGSETMKWKLLEPFLLLNDIKTTDSGKKIFDTLDIRVRVKGGGRVSQCYAIRQAIAKSIV